MTADYQAKKQFLASMISVYGRKPALEMLEDKSLSIHRLHLADSNKPQGIIKDIIRAAESRNVEILYHDRKALSRISRNMKQDQGVVVDVHNAKMNLLSAETLTSESGVGHWLLLDNVTNPQNVGMIIRSAAAAGVNGLIIPRQANASLNALVVKSSAGTLFKAPILLCDTVAEALEVIQTQGLNIAVLAGEADDSLFNYAANDKVGTVYVMGNESDGVSKETRRAATHALSIPMHNEVESLNVAVAASLVAYATQIR